MKIKADEIFTRHEIKKKKKMNDDNKNESEKFRIFILLHYNNILYRHTGNCPK